jgi:hypothetical protein
MRLLWPMLKGWLETRAGEASVRCTLLRHPGVESVDGVAVRLRGACDSSVIANIRVAPACDARKVTRSAAQAILHRLPFARIDLFASAEPRAPRDPP